MKYFISFWWGPLRYAIFGRNQDCEKFELSKFHLKRPLGIRLQNFFGTCFKSDQLYEMFCCGCWKLSRIIRFQWRNLPKNCKWLNDGCKFSWKYFLKLTYLWCTVWKDCQKKDCHLELVHHLSIWFKYEKDVIGCVSLRSLHMFFFPFKKRKQDQMKLNLWPREKAI